MKKTTFKFYFLNRMLIRFFLLLAIVIHCLIAKSNPTAPGERETAFKRAKSLDNGVSISWLEQTWSKDILNENALHPADFALLKKLGFKSIRLPVAFTYFELHNIPVEKVLTVIDGVIKQCNVYGIKLIIDYHYGELDNDNYISETQRVINTWSLLAKRYINKNPDDLLFELYNEPPHMDPQIWKDAAYNITTAIRKIDMRRTLIIGASNFNSIYELSRFVRLADENIIYTFHFYEPFLFTHQGATWAGEQEATTGVPFPYNAEKFPALNPQSKSTWGETNYYQYMHDGNEQSIMDKLTIVKKWGEKYHVPILCGEYGVYNKYADLESRCRYIKAVRNALKTLNIPGMLWDYNTTFSIFDGKPAINTLPDCMKDAIGYKG
ncbi:MAG TPA: cellulase family glycosylhydrolase [Mucilaginibacter sp.]